MNGETSERRMNGETSERRMNGETSERRMNGEAPATHRDEYEAVPNSAD